MPPASGCMGVLFTTIVMNGSSDMVGTAYCTLAVACTAVTRDTDIAPP